MASKVEVLPGEHVNWSLTLLKKAATCTERLLSALRSRLVLEAPLNERAPRLARTLAPRGHTKFFVQSARPSRARRERRPPVVQILRGTFLVYPHLTERLVLELCVCQVLRYQAQAEQTCPRFFGHTDPPAVRLTPGRANLWKLFLQH